jgi:hypothetical protein
VVAITSTLLFKDKMNLEQIAFLKSFVKVFEKARFDVTAVELLNIANQIQTFSKIVVEMETSLKQIPIAEKPIELKPGKIK